MLDGDNSKDEVISCSKVDVLFKKMRDKGKLIHVGKSFKITFKRNYLILNNIYYIIETKICSAAI